MAVRTSPGTAGDPAAGAAVRSLAGEAECPALAHAVRWHGENWVLLDGRRTVVFR
jgi:formyltetrahydrofolate hydrolase